LAQTPSVPWSSSRLNTEDFRTAPRQASSRDNHVVRDRRSREARRSLFVGWLTEECPDYGTSHPLAATSAAKFCSANSRRRINASVKTANTQNCPDRFAGDTSGCSFSARPKRDRQSARTKWPRSRILDQRGRYDHL